MQPRNLHKFSVKVFSCTYICYNITSQLLSLNLVYSVNTGKIILTEYAMSIALHYAMSNFRPDIAFPGGGHSIVKVRYFIFFG